MERREQGFDHLRLQAVADVWYRHRLEQPHRDVTAQGGRRGDEGILAEGAAARLDSREMAGIEIDCPAQRPQRHIGVKA
ncbi:MAG: hypothetical protein QG587_752 [Chloroflexota bacterium]|nr:hypothetical protein [Chloroflexota bacterium]